MKQLLLENPRRRRRVRRNLGRRTPLSPLYRNKPITTGMVDEAYKGNFDDIFRKRKKTTKKGKKGKAVVMNERGVGVPEAEREPSDRGEPATGAPPVAPIAPPVMLSRAEIEANLNDIKKTFVNTLVIRSTEPWSGSMNIAALLETYRKDKATSKWPIECDCKTEDDCTARHTNLYDAVACELKVYAYTNKNEYSEGTHKAIIELIDIIFYKLLDYFYKIIQTLILKRQFFYSI
jgi:hypothetical protein